MSRLIDADALWEKMYKYSDNEGAKMPYGDDDSLIHRDSACFLIEEAPTIDLEPHWIPVTDRLPNIREDVLISYYDEVMVGWLNDDGTWFAEECGRLNMNDIAAWMPLPEPWKGE